MSRRSVSAPEQRIQRLERETVAELFISYAREDQDFVRRLCEALQARGRTVWVDWKDIPPSAEWMAEIDAGIQGADNFVFVLSPDAVLSEVCGREISQAAAHNKRIVPLLRRSVDGYRVPDVVARVNWIPSQAQDNFDAALDALLTAVDTDLDWVREQTRLTTRAVEWDQEHQNRSYLLRGSDLQAAERWLSASAAHDPPATALQVEYILASRRDVTRRQRLVIGALTAGLVVVTALGLLAYGLFLTAEHRSRVNLARRMATEAQLVVSEDRPQLRLLEATEAVMVSLRAGDAAEPAAVNALLDALTNIGGIGMAGHEGAVTALAISPDSRWTATGGQDGAIRLWDLAGCQGDMNALALNGHSSAVTHIAFTPDGHWLVSADSEGVSRLWPVPPSDSSAGAKALAEHSGSVSALALDEAGRWLATGGDDGLIHVYDVAAGQFSTPTLVLGPLEGSIFDLALSPDGRWLFADDASSSPPVLWDLDVAEGGPARFVLESPSIFGTTESSMPNVAFLVDLEAQRAFSPPCQSPGGECGRWLVTIDSAFRPVLWDLTASNPEDAPIVLAGHDPPMPAVSALAFSPDRRWLVTGGLDKKFHIWDTTTFRGEPTVYVYDNHRAPVTAVAFERASHLVTADSDGTLYRWDLSGSTPLGALISIMTGDTGPRALAISQDQRWLVGLGVETVTAWELTDDSGRTSGQRLAGHDEPLADMILSPDGRLLLTSSYDGTARCWNLVDLQPSSAPKQHSTGWSEIMGAQIDPTYRRVIARTWSGDLYVWSVDDSGSWGDPVKLTDTLSGFGSESFSPDGRWLATETLSGAAYLWDLDALPAATVAVKLADEDQPLTAFAFDARGTQLAAGREDGRIELWDLASPDLSAPVRTMTDASSAVHSVAFALDGQVVFSGHDGGVLQRWSLSDAGSTTTLSAQPERRIERLLTTPDGRSLLVAYDDTTVEMWPADQAGVTAPERIYAYEYHLLGDVGVSPDGRWLALGTQTGQVRLWALDDDTQSVEPILLPGHEGRIVDLEFDGEGQRLFTASSDGTVRAWDIAEPDPAREPWIMPAAVGDNPRPIGGIAFNAARDELIIGAADGTVRVWPLNLDRLVALACTATGRNLSAAEWSRFSIDTAAPRTCPGKP